MTTQIVQYTPENLAQAEQELRSRDVVSPTGFVEGRQLLEVCGFSLTNAKARIDEQISRHGMENPRDFTVSVVRDGRHNVNVYQFTVNAANHILLAAMTAQGRIARQEAIDARMEQQDQFETDPLALALQASLATRRNVLAIQAEQERLKIEQQEQGTRVEALEDAMRGLETRVTEVPEGCMIISGIKAEFASGMSKAKIENVLNKIRWPKVAYTVYGEGYSSQSWAYPTQRGNLLAETLHSVFDRIRREKRPTGDAGVYYTHRWVDGRFQW